MKLIKSLTILALLLTTQNHYASDNTLENKIKTSILTDKEKLKELKAQDELNKLIVVGSLGATVILANYCEKPGLKGLAYIAAWMTGYGCHMQETTEKEIINLKRKIRAEMIARFVKADAEKKELLRSNAATKIQSAWRVHKKIN